MRRGEQERRGDEATRTYKWRSRQPHPCPPHTIHSENPAFYEGGSGRVMESEYANTAITPLLQRSTHSLSHSLLLSRWSLSWFTLITRLFIARDIKRFLPTRSSTHHPQICDDFWRGRQGEGEKRSLFVYLSIYPSLVTSEDQQETKWSKANTHTHVHTHTETKGKTRPLKTASEGNATWQTRVESQTKAPKQDNWWQVTDRVTRGSAGGNGKLTKHTWQRRVSEGSPVKAQRKSYWVERYV